MSDERRSGRSCRARLVRWLPVGLVAAVLAFAFPAVAGATDYCVDTTPACGTKNVASFQEALSQAAAAADADRIFLGAGTHTAPSASGFDYYSPAGPVEVIGAGQGGPSTTEITGPSGATGHVLSLIGGPGTSIHDLRIYLPPNGALGLTGLRTNGTARRIGVGEILPQGNPRYGVTLIGGVLDDSAVYLALGGSTSGVIFDTGGGTIRDSGVTAYRGILSSYGGLIERSGVLSRADGVIASRNQTTIRSSQIRVQGAAGTGIAPYPSPGINTDIVADGVNIVGEGGPSAVGVRVDTAYAPASNATLTLTNSLLRGFAINLQAEAGGSGAARITASYSDYDASKNHFSGANASIAEANISNVGDAGFHDALDGDYTLLPSSPLVDAGDPATAQGLDYASKPLVTDGNLDGTARRDIGAYELDGPLPSDQPIGGGGAAGAGGGGGAQGPVVDGQAPLLSGFASTKKVFAVGRARTAISASAAHRTRFRYTLSEPARVTITVQRALKGRYRTVGKLTRNGRQGANSTRFTGRIGRRALRPGRYRAVARATDAAQNRSAPSRARFRIAAR
jgi:hypothetical protein